MGAAELLREAAELMRREHANNKRFHRAVADWLDAEAGDYVGAEGDPWISVKAVAVAVAYTDAF